MAAHKTTYTTTCTTVVVNSNRQLRLHYKASIPRSLAIVSAVTQTYRVIISHDEKVRRRVQGPSYALLPIETCCFLLCNKSSRSKNSVFTNGWHHFRCSRLYNLPFRKVLSTWWLVRQTVHRSEEASSNSDVCVVTKCITRRLYLKS